jgi:hypothetical protein
MRPNEERPPTVAGSRQEGTATTPFQHERIAGGKDTAQASLDDYVRDQVERARDTGLLTAERDDQEWADRALQYLEGPQVGLVVSADDLRHELGTSPAMGSVFRKASRAGLIEAHGITESSAPSRRKGITRTWVRLP